MEEESFGTKRAEYAERIKVVVKEGLDQEVHPSEIKAEGKLIILEYFSDEIDQAREWVNFLEILEMYLRAKVEREEVTVKPSFFGRKPPKTELAKALRVLGYEVLTAKRELNSLESDRRTYYRAAESTDGKKD